MEINQSKRNEKCKKLESDEFDVFEWFEIKNRHVGSVMKSYWYFIIILILNIIYS